jgi:hypothetical protein
MEGITRIITASKDDSPAANQAAMFKVAGSASISGSGGLILRLGHNLGG